MSKNGNFVIADIFEKKEIKQIEKIMKHFFTIEKRESITINVRHAMNLDKPRVEKIVNKYSADN
jgi:hypothetical protein